MNVDLRVYVLLDIQQIIGHSLEGQLVQERRDGIEPTVDDDELRAPFVYPLQSIQKCYILTERECEYLFLFTPRNTYLLHPHVRGG